MATEPQASFNFDVPLPRKVEHFQGETFVPKRDGERLTTLLDRVREEMRDGKWKTLEHIARVCRGGVPSVSARLRDLQRPEHGGHLIEKKFKEKGLWIYRMVTK